MTHTLYTWGYTGTKPADLQAYHRALNASVLDIRFSPRSRVPHWNPDAIKRLLTDPVRYFYLRELGNENWSSAGGPIILHAPDRALDLVGKMLQYHPAILLCACERVGDCHRLVAAHYLAARLGCPVEHLPGSYENWIRS